MRKAVDNTDNLEARAETAKSLAKTATIKSVNPTEASTNEPAKVASKKKVKPRIDLDALLDDKSKFTKVSNKKSSYSLNVNLYQKAALYIVSLKSGITKKAVIDNHSFNDIIKIAEKAGLDESVVEELFDKGKIK